MKKIVSILLFSLQAFSQSVLLDIKSLSETIATVSEDRKLINTRLFLKSSGDNWEGVQACGGIMGFNNDWYSRLRLSDAVRISQNPEKNPTEARAMNLVSQSLAALSRGDNTEYARLQREIAQLNVGLSSCGLEYSSIDAEVLRVLMQARIAVGAELKEIFLSGWRSDRRLVYMKVMDCQRSFASGKETNLECYRNIVPKKNQADHALSLIKESAILTLLIERNQNPPCFSFDEIGEKDTDNWHVGSFMSPLFDREKEAAFGRALMLCAVAGRK